jgi:nucleoid DNA-binding protein
MFNDSASLWRPAARTPRLSPGFSHRASEAKAVGARQEGLMTKADIVDEIAERTGLTKKDVADTVDQFLEAVSRALASGKHIEIRGFGTFKVKDRKSRLARNPRTGESVPVPPRRVPVFKVSKELKDIVAQI